MKEKETFCWAVVRIGPCGWMIDYYTPSYDDALLKAAKFTKSAIKYNESYQYIIVESDVDKNVYEQSEKFMIEHYVNRQIK